MLPSSFSDTLSTNSSSSCATTAMSVTSSVVSGSNNSTYSSSSQSSGVNVQVLLRCRPLNEKEKGQAISVDTSPYMRKELKVHQKLVHGKEITKTFTFDRVYGPQTTQKEFFDESIKSIVDEALDGFNCTIFAYGQTSSGKTFTMEGRRDPNDATDSQAGVIPRSIYHIFQTLESNKTEYTVKVSCMELYNEELQDLLTDRQNKLKIFDDNTGRKGTVVAGLEEIVVRDASQIISIVEDAQKRRQIAETNLNKSSSRSHCITTITIHMREVNDEGEEFIKTGKLNLVDLAGSENIGRSGAIKQRAKEAGMINQSLLTLGRVITALTEHSPHVPYRESKLTRILQDSLGGKTKTCLIATISPSVLCLEETLSTLDYAFKAKSIKNKPEVNMKVSKAQLIKEMSADMEKLKAELNAQRLKHGIYMAPEIYEETNRKLQEQECTIRDLEDQLQLKLKEYEELTAVFKEKERELQKEVQSHSETKSVLTTTTNVLKKTETELKSTKTELDITNFVLEKTQETEEQLLAEAHSLLDGLKDSVQDIDGFIGKVERKSKVEIDNQTLTSMFKETMQEKLNQSEEEIHKLYNTFVNVNTTAKNSIEEFMLQKMTQAKLLGEQMKEITDLFQRSQKELLQLMDNKSSSQGAALDSFQRNNDLFEQKIVKNMFSMKDAFEQSMSLVQNQIENQKQELQKLNNFFVDTLTRNTKYLEIFTTRHNEVMNEMKEQMEHTVELHVNQTNLHSSKLSEMLEQQHKQNILLKQELMKNIEAMIDDTISKQEGEFSQSVSSIQQFFGDSVQSVRNMDATFKKGSQESCNNMEKMKLNLTTNQQEATQSVTKSRMQIDTHIQNVASEASKLTESVKTFCESSNSTVSSNSQYVKQFIQTAKEDQQVFMDQCNASSCKNMSTYQERVSHLNHHITSFDQQVGAFSNTHLDLHNSQLGHVEKFRQGFIETRTNDMKRSLSHFVLNTDQPTGTTPQKKKRKIPDKLPKTKPKDELVELYKLSLPSSLEVPVVLSGSEMIASPSRSDTMDDADSDTLSVASNKENIGSPENISPQSALPPVKPLKTSNNSELSVPSSVVKRKKPATATKVVKTNVIKNENFGVSSFR
ncbi:hypothetical protein FDP41_008267 [Naegleria fowleri]|uniref:Kinesin motor domain-containing protein n=1 Tax=Naegleria fowleri TaxID=5763 RepID=A0A6A5B3M6_NAEFO|nr:uncharacterized protein FDP41_008267 [Naegleria fowleri]KAF0973563.1 hypothetical protein FDP41_008267 [Naegleria fowleri]CAG4709197.1 unnamed protein product [Naegleria fowleri]